jgi:hypothetical protein
MSLILVQNNNESRNWEAPLFGSLHEQGAVNILIIVCQVVENAYCMCFGLMRERIVFRLGRLQKDLIGDRSSFLVGYRRTRVSPLPILGKILPLFAPDPVQRREHTYGPQRRPATVVRLVFRNQGRQAGEDDTG